MTARPIAKRPDPAEVEKVLRSAYDDVKTRKELLAEIKREVDRPPKNPPGPMRKKLARLKGNLSRSLKDADDPVLIEALKRGVEDVQRKLDFWDQKSDEWTDHERLLQVVHGIEPTKPGPGNRNVFLDYVNIRGRQAVEVLTTMHMRRIDAARAVVKRLKPLLPARRTPVDKSSYEFSYRSLLRRRPHPSGDLSGK